MKRFVRFLPLFALMALMAAPVWSAEGRTPVWTDGTIIGADGRYILTRNIVGVGGTPVIEIAASNVDLDLNGREFASELIRPNPMRGGPSVVEDPGLRE